MPSAPKIRTLSSAEVETLLSWAAGEGWNPGLTDAEAFRAADPDGFLGAFVNDEMAAGIAAVAYGESFGFIGLYICRPEQRGKGFGKAVWDAGMARLSVRTIGLDGVRAQQANYRSIGFVPAYRTVRFSGRIACPVGQDIVRVTPELAPGVHAFDRMCFPAPRDAFLAAWLQPPRIVRTSVSEGTVDGFGVARLCHDGYKIGPLFARDSERAAALLVSLATACGGPVHIDVPETQTVFIGRLERLGFAPGFETTRMYRGEGPTSRHSFVFGITSLELG
jgi:GNAT superfamily N-acetyltransferase